MKKSMHLASFLMLFSLFNMEISAEPVPEPEARDYVLVPMEDLAEKPVFKSAGEFRSADPQVFNGCNPRCVNCADAVCWTCCQRTRCGNKVCRRCGNFFGCRTCCD